MKKRLTAAALALVMALSMTPALAASETAYAATQDVEVDGRKVQFQMYALLDANGNGSNYVKLRDIAHVLNGTKAQFSVGYDSTSRSISLSTGAAYSDTGSEMKTPYSGNRTAQTGPVDVLVNGKTVRMDALALTDDNGGGYTYFKLRDLGSALGFKVDWTRERGVIVETGGSTQAGKPELPTVSTYKEYPMVPDFGSFAGIKCIGDAEDEYGIFYIYDGADVLNANKAGKTLEQYGEVLKQKGFELDDAKQGDQGTVIYYHSSAYKDITIAINTAEMNSGSALLINIIDYTKKPAQPTTPPAGTVAYYKDYPNVPDFGIYAGTPLAQGMNRENGYAYLYDAAKVQSEPDDMVKSYSNLLLEKGYQYVGAKEYSDAKFMNFKKGRELVNFGAHYSNGVYYVVEILQETASTTPSNTSNGSGFYAKWPQARDLGAFTGVKPISVEESGGMTNYKYSLADLLKAKSNFTEEYINQIVKDGFVRSHSYDIRDGIHTVGKAIVFHKGKTSLIFKYDSTENNGLGVVTISLGDDPF